jgi:hypothetical protein
MVGRKDVGDESSRSPTLSKAVDEQGVECDIVLMQPSQESQDGTDVDEPPFVDLNETVVNMEPVLGSVGVGDVVVGVGMISCVDPQPIATVGVPTGDEPSVMRVHAQIRCDI